MRVALWIAGIGVVVSAVVLLWAQGSAPAPARWSGAAEVGAAAVGDAAAVGSVADAADAAVVRTEVGEDPAAATPAGGAEAVPAAVFRVVDRRGLPVARATVRLGGGPGARATRASDAEGAVFDAGAVPWLRAAGRPVPVVAVVHGGVGEPVAVDPALAAWPVEVVAPDCGALEVALLDGAGLPWPTGPGSAPARIGVRPLDAERPVAMVAPDAGGVARVGPVAVGQRVELGVVLGEPVVVVVDGPDFAGDVRRVELRADPGVSVLTGRVLAADGRPYAGRLMVDVWSHERAFGGVWLDIADGHFAAPQHSGHLTGSTRIFLRTSMQGDGEVAFVDRGGPLQPGRNDLGDVRLAPVPLLVAGRVVGADGRARRVPMLGLRFSVDDGETWRAAAAPTRWLPDGSFEVRDAALPGAIYAISDGGSGEAVRFAPGARDVTLTRQAVQAAGGESAGGVEFVVLVAPDLPARALGVTCVRGVGPAASSRGAADAGPVAADPGRRSLRVALEPGVYRIGVHVQGVGVVTELDAVLVGPDGTCGDPRLAAIDLRDQLRAVRLVVRGSDGAPLREDAYRIWSRVDDRSWQPSPFEWRARGAERSLWAVARRSQLRVVAAGYRTRIVRVEGDTVDVTLETAPVVRFVPPAELADAVTRGRVRLTVEPVGGEPSEAVTTRSLDADGCFRVAVVADAEHRLSLRWSPDGVPTVELGVVPAQLGAAALTDGARIVLDLDDRARARVDEIGRQR